MRRPRLAHKYKNAEPIAQVTTVKENYRDKEVYIKVDEDGYYLVVFQANNKIIGERVLPSTHKCIKKRSGKKYCYKYVRIPLPWSSKLNYKRTELTVKIYRIEEDGEEAYWQYLADLAAYYRDVVLARENNESDEEDFLFVYV